LSTRLSQEFGDGLDLVLIDQSDSFVFGFSKLHVMFGRARPAGVRHACRDAVKPGVTFVQAGVQAIDPVAKRVETDVGTFEGDVLVVAPGADLDPAITPGLIEGGHEFYTVDCAFAAREVIADFDGGRVIVGVLSTPYKCPPAPSETALLMHEHLTQRGIRDRSEIALVVDFARPIRPSPAASEALVSTFAERSSGTRAAKRATASLARGGELARRRRWPTTCFSPFPYTGRRPSWSSRTLARLECRCLILGGTSGGRHDARAARGRRPRAEPSALPTSPRQEVGLGLP
jgi:hypothetical protein